MEFKCTNSDCGKLFRPHPFIGMRHPSKVKCPDCKSRGKITDAGRDNYKSRFHAINQANIEGAKKRGDKHVFYPDEILTPLPESE